MSAKDNEKYPFTIKKGDTFKLIANSNSHNYEIGKTYVAEKEVKFINQYSQTNALVRGHNTLEARDMFVFVLNQKKDIEKQIIELKKELVDKTKSIKEEIADLQVKLKFMNENKLDEFNETEFKAYKVLQLLKDKKLSDIERAKLIASLVNE